MVTDLLTKLKNLDEKCNKWNNIFNEMKHDENALKQEIIHEIRDYVDGNINLLFGCGDSYLSTISMIINQPNISLQALNKIKSIFNCENIIVTRCKDDMLIHIMLNMSDLE